jgi:hypothetical protein
MKLKEKIRSQASKGLSAPLLATLAILGPPSVQATQVNFIGGTVTLMDGTTHTTNNSDVWQNVVFHKSFWFTAENQIDCFGMDSFFIDEPPPNSVPGPLPLLGVGAAFRLTRRLKKLSCRTTVEGK